MGCATAPPPPPPKIEIRPARPHARAVWVAGHWQWKGKRNGHVWIPGHWKAN
ncbi:MAG: YXWGXW repeat-containing protein [Candidatus Eisenbacteria bacterium]|uniref:YXWGXW repeat-containing protein n=1 Tax=Eiseniibacteriota bacterium TaxID=2212470 RepID=A0A948RSB9_UNCEI|nr:YXWGXW repeat-containing protein [Candidatus Eisenbacteria bacterium]MBU1950264.1 YXWGXW repeat-containing protein [Candidatus Eisenbacteria bacterium]MBU2689970.1 YXWGXW repeat-containing protein [Candidatus Eisenbacteria bacterium]